MTRLGCVELRPGVATDVRGWFMKFFQKSAFHEQQLAVELAEIYFSQSKRGVIRGLHFQLPPKQHAKVVCCVSGAVLDVVVDLRRGAKTYGQVDAVELHAEQGNALYIPEGFAHGFAALSTLAVMAYAVTTEYDRALDTGIRWDSVGFAWPFRTPTVSERDAKLVPLNEFESPFSVA